MSQPIRNAEPPSARSQHRGVLLAIAPVGIWAIHEGLCVCIRSCDLGYAPWGRALLVALSLASLFGTGSCAVLAYRDWRNRSSPAAPSASFANDAAEFVALAGALLGMVASCAVIFGALPPLLLSSLCEAQR